jgi:RHS repeat-associated protein
VQKLMDVLVPPRSWSYGYDKLDRLTAAARSGLSQGWTYDANSNRLTEAGAAPSTYTIAPTNNRLMSTSGALSRTYAYADSGQVVSESGRTYTYNDAGRMTAVSGTANAAYAYNALGQRMRKTIDGVTTYFIYDESGHLIGEYDSSGNLIQEIVWLGDIPVATLRDCSCGDAIFYIHTDHLNTPRRITKRSTTDIVWRWDSDPFGTSAPNTDPDGDGTHFSFNLRFPGQYFDAETDGHYNYFRDRYDPAVGRYTQSDPIGLEGGINTYSYVDARPLHYSDPLGLWIPSMHSRMSREAAVLANCSKKAGELGTATARVDDGDEFPGTQAPKNSFWHAMSDGVAGQTPEDASDLYDDYMNNLASSCDVRDIGRRLHALQDSFSPAHRGFQSWSGFRLRGVFGLIGHGLRDTFASPSTYRKAVVASRSIVDQVRETCPCFCQ